MRWVEISSGTESDRNPKIIRKRQAGLQSEAPTQTAQVHISTLLSPAQLTHVLPGQHLYSCCPLGWDTRFPTSSSTVVSLTLHILQTSALTTLEGRQAPQGEPAPPSTGLQESLPFPLAGQICWALVSLCDSRPGVCLQMHTCSHSRYI